jgi:PAS domain S-box-containing protein
LSQRSASRPETLPGSGAEARRRVDPPSDIGEALATLAALSGTMARLDSRTGTPPSGAVVGGPSADGAGEDSLAEARYRALIEQIPAVTFFASVASGQNEIYVSPQIESLLGFTQEEWVSDPVLWWRQTHPADRDRVSLAFAATCVTGQPFRDVFRVVARSGETVWVHAEARLVRDQQGHPLFLQGVGFDVTEQRQAQETREELIREQAARAEAERERERKDQFLAAATHDLRTPLTSMRGLTQLLERRIARSGGVSMEDLCATLGQLGRSARMMTQLVDQLLDVTRLQMDAPLSLNRQAIDLRALVSATVEDHRPISERHELAFESPPSELWGSWDPARLERVVSNLLMNAIKYSPDGRRVTVRLRRDGAPPGTCATLEVEDEGLGIPASDLPQIFDRFHRAGNVGHLAGTGIGLAYVQQVVAEHGGRVEVRSREGAGSTFTVHLPIEEETSRG